MAKTAGMGDRLYLAGYDVSGDVGSISRIAGGPRPLSVTGINKEAQERLGGIRDGGLDFMSYFNPAAAQAHARLSPLPTTNVLGTYLRGTTIGNPAASCVAKQVNYDPNRGADGSLTMGVQLVSNGFGVEWGDQLTAGARTDTGATAGTAVDFTAGSSFGLQAYLQVTAFSGTDVTITIQESSDNAGDAYANVVGGAFASVTGITSERIATATNLAVERYLKVTTSTTGGFTSVTFVVMVVRNGAVPTF